MDVVLEIVDTFMGDYLYATLHPSKPVPYDFPDLNTNGTASGFDQWSYTPSTSWFSLEPSEYAYMSAWPRDNIYRQGLSLFFITWYVNLSILSLNLLAVLADGLGRTHSQDLRNSQLLSLRDTIIHLHLR